ncbi:MAG: hypothetical protein ACR2O6_10870 [Ilumatobacteraceae bacterium]
MAACGGGDDGAAEPSTAATTDGGGTNAEAGTTTGAPPTTETTTDDAEAAILAAVDGYYASFITVNSPPDPDHPELERFRTEAVLELARENVQDRSDLGQAIRLPEKSRSTHQAIVVSVSGSSAVVDVCSVDDSVLYDVATGVLLNDAVKTFAVQFHLKSTDSWRVVETVEQGRWDGVSTCDG